MSSESFQPRIVDHTMLPQNKQQQPGAGEWKVQSFLYEYRVFLYVIVALIVGMIIMLWFIYPRSQAYEPEKKPRRTTIAPDQCAAQPEMPPQQTAQPSQQATQPPPQYTPQVAAQQQFAPPQLVPSQQQLEAPQQSAPPVVKQKSKEEYEALLNKSKSINTSVGARTNDEIMKLLTPNEPAPKPTLSSIENAAPDESSDDEDSEEDPEPA